MDPGANPLAGQGTVAIHASGSGDLGGDKSGDVLINFIQKANRPPPFNEQSSHFILSKLA